MITFFTDLDNTVVYSHRRNIGTEKTVVEYLDGKQQSFMTDHTYEYLKNAVWIDIIPVTTRTASQFSRLSLQELRISHALICNGGMLMIDGIEDEEWTKGSLDLAGDQTGVLEKSLETVRELFPGTVIHKPTPYMGYFKADDPGGCCELLRKLIDDRDVSFSHDRNKVYCLASSIDKGSAALRYERLTGKGIDLAAGDSEMDVPLLNLARYAFATKRIAGLVRNRNLFVLEGEAVSDEICDIIQMLHVSGEI